MRPNQEPTNSEGPWDPPKPPVNYTEGFFDSLSIYASQGLRGNSPILWIDFFPCRDQSHLKSAPRKPPFEKIDDTPKRNSGEYQDKIVGKTDFLNTRQDFKHRSPVKYVY